MWSSEALYAPETVAIQLLCSSISPHCLGRIDCEAAVVRIASVLKVNAADWVLDPRWYLLGFLHRFSICGKLWWQN